jgi:hypothetical protein
MNLVPKGYWVRVRVRVRAFRCEIDAVDLPELLHVVA